MPTFPTPEPISVRIHAGAGSIRLTATYRADTVVQLRPRDGSRNADVWAAEHTKVDFRDGKLTVSGAKRSLPMFRDGEIDLDIALPARSRVHASLGAADLRAEGEFADVRVASSAGDVEVGSVTGSLSVATASGDVTVGDLDGDLRFKAASGSLTVNRLRGYVKSRTASGSVHVVAAVRGGVSAHTSSGEVALGIPEGTAARLNLVTGSGVITNRLQPSDGPDEGDETLSLSVRSGSGDVLIHRADPAHESVSG